MSRLRRARLASTSEDGFTLIELMVASGVMLAAITAMLYTTFAGFRGIAVARGRQSANGVANQTLEQVRALPYDTLTKGLSNSDSTVTADTAISRSGSVWTYGGETVPHGDNPVTTPLNPHKQTVTKAPTTYTVLTYVTYYVPATTTTTIVSGSQPGGNPFRVTVVVQWTSTTGSTSQVQAQTIVYSPSGCLSSATHPFSAPCQAFLYASSGVQGGSVTMTGPISGIPLDHAALWLAAQTSGMQIEQIQAVQGTAQTSGVTLQLQGAPNEDYKGRQQVSSGADTDPSQTKPDYQKNDSSAQSTDFLHADGNGNQLKVSFGTGDTASTMSTVTANTADHPCPLLVPSSSFDITQPDSQPCGNGKGKQGGTLTGVLSMLLGSQVDTTLASVGAAATPSGVFTNRDIAPPEATVCASMPTSTNDGCVQAQQYRALGTVTLLQLPVGLAGLPGYDPTKGLVRLTGYTDSVTAEAGVGAAAPAATIASGTIEYYDGATYQTMTPTSTPTRIPFGLQGNGVVAGNALTLQVSVTGDLWTGGTSTSDPAPTGCPASLACRNEASASARSPLLGSLTYSMTYLGTNVATVTTAIDLGTLVAKTSYTAAPSGT